jgi:transcriptional antiterminator
MRTTQAALSEFEATYEIAFNQDEVGLIAVIFGAWLMQKSDLHEKQVVLLTTTILFWNRRWNFSCAN